VAERQAEVERRNAARAADEARQRAATKAGLGRKLRHSGLIRRRRDLGGQAWVTKERGCWNRSD
jgi:hypothetical protein